MFPFDYLSNLSNGRSSYGVILRILCERTYTVLLLSQKTRFVMHGQVYHEMVFVDFNNFKPLSNAGITDFMLVFNK